MNPNTAAIGIMWIQSKIPIAYNIKKIIDLFRKNKMKIIYTMFSSFNKDGSDLTRKIKGFNEITKEQYGDVLFPHKDHAGSQIVNSLKPKDEDLIVIKNTSGESWRIMVGPRYLLDIYGKGVHL